MRESLQRKIFAHKIFDPNVSSLRKCVYLFVFSLGGGDAIVCNSAGFRNTGHFLAHDFRTLAYSDVTCVSVWFQKIMMRKILESGRNLALQSPTEYVVSGGLIRGPFT